MKEIKETCYKGTRILLGDEKRDLINKMIYILKESGYTEIQIPVIQYQEIFSNNVGEENNNMMFNFSDRANRNICLAPEYTAVIQRIAKTEFKNKKDVKVFYVAECFRGEKPQSGRYRQFTQLGVEVINPTKYFNISGFATDLIMSFLDKKPLEWIFKNIIVNRNAKRGLDYYKNGQGFEITCESLGSSKQICGGGEYDGGVGFAIGIDRLMLIK